MSPADRRSLLERYHAALSSAVEMTSLINSASKYAGRLPTERESIFRAHLARVNGESSPAECDAKAREVIG